MSFGPNVYSPGKYVNCLSFFNGKPMIAMENFKVTCPAVSGSVQSLVCPLIPILKGVFGPNGRAVQSWEVC